MPITTSHGYVLAEPNIANVAVTEVAGAYELVFIIEPRIHAMSEHVREEGVVALNFLSGRVKIKATKSNQQAALGNARSNEYSIREILDHPENRQLTLALPLSAQQLSAIETFRDSEDLTFELNLWIDKVGMAPGTGHANSEVKLSVPRSEWLQHLRQANYADTLLLEVPMPKTESSQNFETVRRHLLKAQSDFLLGRYSDTVATCRNVFSELSTALGFKEKWDADALNKISSSRRDMTSDEREKCIFAAIRHYTNLAHHSESEGGSPEYTRNNAQMILTMTAACVRFGQYR